MTEKKELKQGDPVEIVWVDSCDMQKLGWFPAVLLDEFNDLAEIQSFGIFCGETKDAIKLVGSRNTNPDYVTLLRGELVIPKGAIKTMRVSEKWVEI